MGHVFPICTKNRKIGTCSSDINGVMIVLYYPIWCEITPFVIRNYTGWYNTRWYKRYRVYGIQGDLWLNA
jgi:hypothetical protein